MRCGALDVEPDLVGGHRADRGEHQRRALQREPPVALQPRAPRERPQVLVVRKVGRQRRQVRHRDADAVVAVALEIGLLEMPELRHVHLEPQSRRRGETGRRRVDALVAGLDEPARGVLERLRDRRRRRDAVERRARRATTVKRRGSGGPSSGTGTHHGSRGSRAAIARKPSRTSCTVRASGPCTLMSCAEIARSAFSDGWNAGTRPNDGRSPASPQQYAG